MKKILENILAMDDKEYERFKMFCILFFISCLFYLASSLYAINGLRNLTFSLASQLQTSDTPQIILPEILDEKYGNISSLDSVLQTR